ncbi:hypothetical protein OG552_10195 [Streptomyces sp. NBC_01476]|uniref:hypothetical protein n=1 Tax=Streptomyces sp. NBC_01476 TaxID=2903881 RepID=UPI002E36C513|nr:hypothetical protein [Streptomyces sp. NBC_01476]
MTTTPRSHAVTVTPRPDGCDLDVTGFVRHLLADVIGLLADRPELMDDLDRVVTGGEAPDLYHPERHLPTEQLVEDLLAALPASALAIRLHQAATERLARNLTPATPTRPAQRSAA